MGRIPSLKGEEVVRALEKAGFQVIRQQSSHARLKHLDQRLVTVPVHPGHDLGRGILRKILRDAKLTPEEFLSFLRV